MKSVRVLTLPNNTCFLFLVLSRRYGRCFQIHHQLELGKTNDLSSHVVI